MRRYVSMLRLRHRFMHTNEQDDMECPLCLEEIDISDANFKPCPCGYQICRFCWHHIKQNLNGRCPACRRKYSDQAIEFKAMSTEEYVRVPSHLPARTYANMAGSCVLPTRKRTRSVKSVKWRPPTASTWPTCGWCKRTSYMWWV